MRLAQNQVYRLEEKYVRIVQLDRSAVQYKVVTSLLTRTGVHHNMGKKEFCRLIKGGSLLTQAEVREIWLQEGGMALAQTRGVMEIE